MDRVGVPLGMRGACEGVGWGEWEGVYHLWGGGNGG